MFRGLKTIALLRKKDPPFSGESSIIETPSYPEAIVSAPDVILPPRKKKREIEEIKETFKVQPITIEKDGAVFKEDDDPIEGALFHLNNALLDDDSNDEDLQKALDTLDTLTLIINSILSKYPEHQIRAYPMAQQSLNRDYLAIQEALPHAFSLIPKDNPELRKLIESIWNQISKRKSMWDKTSKTHSDPYEKETYVSHTPERKNEIIESHETPKKSLPPIIVKTEKENSSFLRTLEEQLKKRLALQDDDEEGSLYERRKKYDPIKIEKTKIESQPLSPWVANSSLPWEPSSVLLTELIDNAENDEEPFVVKEPLYYPTKEDRDASVFKQKPPSPLEHKEKSFDLSLALLEAASLKKASTPSPSPEKKEEEKKEEEIEIKSVPTPSIQKKEEEPLLSSLQDLTDEELNARSKNKYSTLVMTWKKKKNIFEPPSPPKIIRRESLQKSEEEKSIAVSTPCNEEAQPKKLSLYSSALISIGIRVEDENVSLSRTSSTSSLSPLSSPSSARSLSETKEAIDPSPSLFHFRRDYNTESGRTTYTPSSLDELKADILCLHTKLENADKEKKTTSWRKSWFFGMTTFSMKTYLQNLLEGVTEENKKTSKEYEKVIRVIDAILHENPVALRKALKITRDSFDCSFTLRGKSFFRTTGEELLDHLIEESPKHCVQFKK